MQPHLSREEQLLQSKVESCDKVAQELWSGDKKYAERCPILSDRIPDVVVHLSQNKSPHSRMLLSHGLKRPNSQTVTLFIRTKRGARGRNRTGTPCGGGF